MPAQALAARHAAHAGEHHFEKDDLRVRLEETVQFVGRGSGSHDY
jgi:hypothetical protein